MTYAPLVSPKTRVIVWCSTMLELTDSYSFVIFLLLTVYFTKAVHVCDICLTIEVQ